MSVLAPTRPRVFSAPEYASSAGGEAIDLAREAGLVLDDWQADVLERSLGERADGKWAAFEVGLNIARQNGKGALLEARELAGLYLLGEGLIIHSAHQFDTSLEAFSRLLFLVENNDYFRRKVKRVSRSHGEEGIELLGRRRVRFRTRTKGGGRGFTADCLIYDECMILPEASHGATLPTLSARPNPQVWYTGSAVDQLVHEHGVVWARVRERGIAGDPSLAYFEWSVEGDDPSHLSPKAAADPEAWAQANPALGIRISREHVERERRSMDPRTFAVERLGVGDWPDTDPLGESVIDLDVWRGLTDPQSSIAEGVHFAFDVTPNRRSASIAAAGRREDQLVHLEVVDQRPGTGWVVDRLVELVDRHSPVSVSCDGGGPAATLVEALEDRDVAVTTLSSGEYARACGHLFDAVENREVRHLGTVELESAIRGAAKRPLVDQWAWSRKTSRVDITPLVAVTLAGWAASTVSEGPTFVLEVLS